MELRNGLDGLKALLGASAADIVQARQMERNASPEASNLDGDRATVSDAGSEALRTASDEGVRMERVTAVQAALAAGTYDVPANDVAAKVIDSMIEPRASGD